jgi:hypothetical protein
LRPRFVSGKVRKIRGRKLSGVMLRRSIAVVLVEYMMKEIQTVNAQLYYSDCDRSYMFRLHTTIKLCTDGFISVIMEVVLKQKRIKQTGVKQDLQVLEIHLVKAYYTSTTSLFYHLIDSGTKVDVPTVYWEHPEFVNRF